jgi:hypothetical protein
MKTSIWAKIFGWVQFGLQTVAQVSTGGVPHNWHDWLSLIASGALAVGMHAAASTDGTK